MNGDDSLDYTDKSDDAGGLSSSGFNFGGLLSGLGSSATNIGTAALKNRLGLSPDTKASTDRAAQAVTGTKTGFDVKWLYIGGAILGGILLLWAILKK